MSKYMPLEGGEITQLQFMYSLYRCVAEDESLKKRLGSIRLWWRYKGIVKQLYTIFDKTWQTIDPATRARIDRLWEMQELRIVNVNAPVDPTGDMVMIPKDAIQLWGQHCQKESCAICYGNNNDRKDCKFRKGMVKRALPDLRRLEKKYGKCMGKIFDWE